MDHIKGLSSISSFFIFGELMTRIVWGCTGMRIHNGGAVEGPNKSRTNTLMEQRDSSIEISLFFV
jgi:hypothetical protein